MAEEPGPKGVQSGDLTSPKLRETTSSLGRTGGTWDSSPCDPHMRCSPDSPQGPPAVPALRERAPGQRSRLPPSPKPRGPEGPGGRLESSDFRADRKCPRSHSHSRFPRVPAAPSPLGPHTHGFTASVMALCRPLALLAQQRSHQQLSFLGLLSTEPNMAAPGRKNRTRL